MLVTSSNLNVSMSNLFDYLNIGIPLHLLPLLNVHSLLHVKRREISVILALLLHAAIPNLLLLNLWYMCHIMPQFLFKDFLDYHATSLSIMKLSIIGASIINHTLFSLSLLSLFPFLHFLLLVIFLLLLHMIILWQMLKHVP